MSHCFLSKNQNQISIDKFMNVAEIVYENNIPYTTENDAIMICSPVGNQSKFLKSDIKADIVLSGYSTAPDTAISYLQDIKIQKSNYPELKNAFGTPTMQKGISELFQSLGFLDIRGLLFSSLSPVATPHFNLLFTQMLCMISKNGSSQARDVDEILQNSYSIREHAEHCLAGWYERIKKCVKKDGIILLMGKDAENLINNSYFIDESRIKIDFHNSRSKETLLERIGKDGFKLFHVMHGAAFSYNDNKEKWMHSQQRISVNQYLAEHFPNYVGMATPV